MRTLRLLPLCLLILMHAAAQPTCGNVQLQLTPDYSFAIGSSTGGSAYTITQSGQTLASGPMTQLALLHYDNTLNTTSGSSPSNSAGAAFDTGKFGKGLYLQTGTGITYPGALFNGSEGTVEMWIAPRFNGSDPAFSTAGRSIFTYQASNGDFFTVGEDSLHQGRIIYTGAQVNGQWESAYASGGDMTAWKAGQWHHVAATFSASASHIRFYLDGVKIADNNEGHYFAPSATGGSILVGATAFTIDELRISNVALADSAVAFDAARTAPLAENEVMFSLAGVSPGPLNYSVTGCGSATFNFSGIPISNFAPPNGLLSAGSANVTLTFNTAQPTTCRYSAGNPLVYTSMLALDTGPPTAIHSVVAGGLSTDPQVLNRLYVRCASAPDYLQSATYRVVAAPTGSFPRIGNIWLGDYLNRNQPALAKKVQLFLGPNGMSPADAGALRAANPDVLIVPAIQVDDAFDFTLPENYYLHDTNGKRVSDWCSPPSYVYNMTRPEVATYVGQQAYQVLAESNWAFDGLFFDSFGTSYPANLLDCYGNTVKIDANGDGLPDDQAQLNAAWAAGEYLVVSTFRTLAPGAYVSGHVLDAPAQPGSLATFNGTSIEFFQQSVREGQASFGTLWDLYQSWETQAVSPTFTLMQSAPPDQIAYGYGYYPIQATSTALATFAQTYYPNMRFGLALALMGDGFFTHDIGDMAPNAPTAWWYDEYDFNLGYPLGPAAHIGDGPSANLVRNGGFENGLAGTWQLDIQQGKATQSLDPAVAADGNSSAHVAVASPASADYQISFEQENLTLVAGTSYQVQFWARADTPRTITVHSQGGAPNYTDYNLNTLISVGTSWGFYTTSFTAPLSVNDARLEFWVGAMAGNIWFDDVQLRPTGGDLYRRDFTKGSVLLNGTSSGQTVPGLTGLQRFNGTQAPLYQYIVDDADAGFSATGAWSTATFNTGSLSYAGSSKNLPPEPQNANGPFYHTWLGACQQLDAPSGSAQWSLSLPADGAYTIQVWLPAAPNAASWTKSAVYEVVSKGDIVASTTIDQTTASAGDGWHTIATNLSLAVAGTPFVRVHNGGAGSLIADAVYVSSAALYNDGSPVQQVALAPFDGILLQRQTPAPAPSSRVNSVVNAGSFQPAITSGGFVAIIGTGFGASKRSWTSSDFSGNDLPVSLDGTSVTINGKPAYIAYVSPTQVNAIAPDDDTIGEVEVQVTTPQGASYTQTVLKQTRAPAFFTYQSGTTSYIAAVHLDGSLVGPTTPTSRPAIPGEVIELYATGSGSTNPGVPTSQLVSQPALLTLPATVKIGTADAEVQWAGIVSSGLYLLNVKIPNVGAGDLAVQANIAGFQTAPNAFLSVGLN
ncbi:MAG TPA: LamG-like jellyroll fold domain-containing protein [Terracidiphilus sp.]